MQLGGSHVWMNVDTQQHSDVYQDHVLVHLGGSLNCSTSLGYWRPYNIAGGEVQVAKIQYLPHIKMQYFVLMTANKNQILYLKDNGKVRSIRTLAVLGQTTSLLCLST
jgi:hypothetical protein